MANPQYGQNKADNAIDAGKVHVIETIAARSLTAAESGAIVMITESESAIYTISLPSVVGNAGVNYTFIVKAVSGTGDYDVTIAQSTDDSNNIVFGNINGAATFVDVAHDGIIFDTGTCTAGDCVSLVCDGAGWYITFGTSSAAGGIDVYNA